MGWSDPIVAGNNWSGRGAGSTLELLSQAVSERYRAAFGDNSHPAGPDPVIPVPAAGDFVARRLFYNDYVSAPGQLPTLQHTVAADLLGGVGSSPFVDHTQAFTGVGTFPAAWTMATVRAAAGLPTAYDYAGTSGSAATLIGTNNVFRRKRYREVAGLTAVRDTQGNAAAAGQRARLTTDGTLYRCVASGDWTRDESTGPDVLDNTLAPPNTVSWQLVPYGGAQAGDILGAWVYEELRKILDLLRWTLAVLSPSDLRDKSVSDGGTTAASYAAAATAAAAAYGAASISNPAGYALDVGASGHVYAVSDGTYKWHLLRADRSWDALDAFSGALSALTKRPVWYTKAAVTNRSFYDQPGHVDTFDAQGDPVTNGTYSLWQTQADTAGAVNSGNWGSIATAPALAADPGSGSGLTATKGYRLTDVQCVLKWNVAGGFQHCTAFV